MATIPRSDPPPIGEAHQRRTAEPSNRVNTYPLSKQGVPEPRDDWRRWEDDPIGFLAQNKPLSRARRNLATCAGASPALAELSYAHGARDLPDQAERTEGQGSRSGQEQSKRRGTTRAKCSAIAPRRGLRRTRGSPPFGASTCRYWTSAVKRGSSGSTHGTTGDTSRSGAEITPRSRSYSRAEK